LLNSFLCFRPSFNVGDFLDTTTPSTATATTTTELLSVPLPNIPVKNEDTNLKDKKQEDRRLEDGKQLGEDEEEEHDKRFRGGLGWVRPTPKGFSVRQGLGGQTDLKGYLVSPQIKIVVLDLLHCRAAYTCIVASFWKSRSLNEMRLRL
jgi:hypothetical protein